MELVNEEFYFSVDRGKSDKGIKWQWGKGLDGSYIQVSEKEMFSLLLCIWHTRGQECAKQQWEKLSQNSKEMGRGARK